MSVSETGASLSYTILRLPQVCKMTGLGKTLIYELEAAERFPKRIKIGIRAVGWLEGEIKGWLVSRIENRGSSPVRNTGGR
jgi:prophage regulatory protein